MDMTSRERLACLFAGGTPDRVGSTFLINPYFTNSLPDKPDPMKLMGRISLTATARCPTGKNIPAA